jgi:hypothetical protein
MPRRRVECMLGEWKARVMEKGPMVAVGGAWVEGCSLAFFLFFFPTNSNQLVCSGLYQICLLDSMESKTIFVLAIRLEFCIYRKHNLIIMKFK